MSNEPIKKIIDEINKDTEIKMKELEAAKAKFIANHSDRRRELNEAINRMNKSVYSYETSGDMHDATVLNETDQIHYDEIDKTLDEISKDLDELLNDL